MAVNQGQYFTTAREKTASQQWEKIGDVLQGVIVELDERQESDVATRELKWWENKKPTITSKLEVKPGSPGFAAKPVMQLIAKVMKEDGDVVSLWFTSGVREAVGLALEEASATELEIGGMIGVKYTGTMKTTFGSKKNVFEAGYQSPEEADSE